MIQGGAVMLYTIKNEHIFVSVQTKGAELQSIKSADGTEYLWQGDPTYWEDRSPTIFPYVGRTIGNRFEYKGKEYPIKIHGFAPYQEFTLKEQATDKLVFMLRDNPQTRAQYPWKFCFTVTYQINDSRLDITYTVENLSKHTMLFGIGGHPGFNVPLQEDECFTDYRLRFTEKCIPERILFTSDCYVEDHTVPYPLDLDNSIPLRHEIFDEDAIVLKSTPKSVTLENKNSSRSVTVSFPQMEYIGFWHEVKMEAPYVCIEPWSSLPSPKGEKTVLEDQTDLLRLDAGKTYVNAWSISID